MNEVSRAMKVNLCIFTCQETLALFIIMYSMNLFIGSVGSK